MTRRFKFYDKSNTDKGYYDVVDPELRWLTKQAHNAFTHKKFNRSLKRYSEIYQYVNDNMVVLSINDSLFSLNKYLKTLGRQSFRDDIFIEKLAIEIIDLFNKQSPSEYLDIIISAIAYNLCHISLLLKNGAILDQGLKLYDALSEPNDHDVESRLIYLYKQSFCQHKTQAALIFTNELINIRVCKMGAVGLILPVRHQIKIMLFKLYEWIADFSKEEFVAELAGLTQDFWPIYDTAKANLTPSPANIKQFSDTLSVLYFLKLTEFQLAFPDAEDNFEKICGYIKNQIMKLQLPFDLNKAVLKSWRKKEFFYRNSGGVFTLEHPLYDDDGIAPPQIDINLLGVYAEPVSRCECR